MIFASIEWRFSIDQLRAEMLMKANGEADVQSGWELLYA